MEDNLTIIVTGRYLGINSNNGVGKQRARIFVRREDGSDVDGLVPVNVYNGLKRGDTYNNLRMTKANNPALTRRTWV
jgi:hypothetical protein